MAAYTLDDFGNLVSDAATSAKNKVVNLFKSDDAPGDYSSRRASLARQQKLADALSQMGAQEQAVSTAGGITAPVSGMGALARGLSSFGGAYLSGKAAADEAALKKSERSQFIEKLKNYETTPGETVSTPEQSISANMPAIPRATFDRATGTFSPGADTQTTPTNINIPKYEFVANQRPTTLTEKSGLALQNMETGSEANQQVWAGKYADVVKKQQLLENLMPRANAIIANPDAPKNIVNDLIAEIASQDVNSMESTLKTAQDKMTANAPSAMDATRLDAFKTSNAARVAKGQPLESFDQYKSRMDINEFSAKRNITDRSERALALYRDSLGGKPSASEKLKQESLNAWKAIPGNENGTVAQYDAYAAGLMSAAQAKGRLGATLDFGESISIDNPTVVAAGKAQLMGNPMTVPQIYKGAVDRYIVAQKDAYTPAAQSKYIRNAQMLSANYMKLPEYQALASVRTPLNRIKAAVKAGHTAVSDQDMIDAMTQLSKASLQARAVTDSQVKLITGYGSWSDMASRLMNRAGGRGGALSDQQRKDIVKLSSAIAKEYQNTYGAVYNDLSAKLEENGIPKKFWTIPDLIAIESSGESASIGANGRVPAGIGLTQSQWNHASPEDAAEFK